MFMKQQTKSKTVLVAATLLGLAVLPAAVGKDTAWAMAGFLGLAMVGLSATIRQPKMAPVRIRSPKGRN